MPRCVGIIDLSVILAMFRTRIPSITPSNISRKNYLNFIAASFPKTFHFDGCKHDTWFSTVSFSFNCLAFIHHGVIQFLHWKAMFWKNLAKENTILHFLDRYIGFKRKSSRSHSSQENQFHIVHKSQATFYSVNNRYWKFQFISLN